MLILACFRDEKIEAQDDGLHVNYDYYVTGPDMLTPVTRERPRVGPELTLFPAFSFLPVFLSYL